MCTYDLGDSWYHTIKLHEIIAGQDINDNRLILAGEIRCPDEDGEGCMMYQYIVLILEVLSLRKGTRTSFPRNVLIATLLLMLTIACGNHLDLKVCSGCKTVSAKWVNECLSKVGAQKGNQGKAD